ncbi:hypothetical protein [uncultured Winogradskyella sp.]|nr:hypothetical protein [uncultured Winogradskyella sp.]
MNTTLNQTITELKLKLVYSKSNLDEVLTKMKEKEVNYRIAV